MPMLAELVDAVIGVDTHRDTHQAEIATAAGTPIATITVGNDSAGYQELLGWIFEHAPSPKLAVAIEGTRSYGIGLARAGSAAGPARRPGGGDRGQHRADQPAARPTARRG